MMSDENDQLENLALNAYQTISMFFEKRIPELEGMLDAGFKGVRLIEDYSIDITSCLPDDLIKLDFANDIAIKSGLPKLLCQYACLALTFVALCRRSHPENQEFRSSGLAIGLYYCGKMEGYLDGMTEAIDIRQEKMRRAGKRGAISRHTPSAALKAWALAEAAKMRGSDMEVARKLARNLPQHLNDVSKDPERLIYGALRSDNG